LKTKLALIVVSVILVGSLVANAYFYALQQHGLAAENDLKKQAADLQSQLSILINQTNSLQSEHANLSAEMADLEGQAANLRNKTASLQSENSNLQSENAAIQNQIDQIGTPKILTRLGATDVRSTPAAGHPWSGIIRFYISGEVWNIGTGAAKDCKLHVTIYQGEIVANETYVELGTINAGSYTDVAANIYYTGEALTNWTITPEYA
jgi:regulator of replication initiation timing